MRTDRNDRHALTPSRREALRLAGGGFGALALAWMLHDEQVRADDRGGGDPLAPRPPHFPAKAKRVISLFMHGGPSHLETFDPKPDLQRLHGQPLPESFGPVPTRRKVAGNPLLGTKRTFARCGESGLRDLRLPPPPPRLRRRAGGDPLVLGRQRQPPAGRLSDEHRFGPDGPAEPRELGRLRPRDREPRPARLRRPARPSAAGSRAARRPTAPASCRPATRGPTSGAARPDPQPPSPRGPRPATTSGGSLDLIGRLNRPAPRPGRADDELEARIRSYELAYRMQSAAPEAVDLAGESAETRALYGLDDPTDRRIRHPLPAGPPAGRAGRPVRPALLGRRDRLGRPRRRRDEPRRDVRPDRPAGRRPADRPEAARPPRRHPGDLGRRVRPDAHVRGRQGPRPQPARLHRLARRGRRQGRAPSTARPTPSASAPRSTASTSTTCTRRSSTCSASTTPA